MSLYKKYGFILGVLKPQPYPEDVIETVNSQNWYNRIIGFDTSFHSMIWSKKSRTGYLQLEESTTITHFDVLFYLVWSHHWLKMPHFGHISCLLKQETILFQIWEQKTSGPKLGFLLPIMSMAVTWHRLHMGPWICILPERHHSRTPYS